jgi:gamma-glutamyltranspeptidase/glutathione hydrolase
MPLKNWLSNLLTLVTLLTSTSSIVPTSARAEIEQSDADRPATAAQAHSGQTHFGQIKPVQADSFMVSAAHPLAVAAGYDILQGGGNAIDAAITVQLVLTLVEPQYSGIGGGAFALYFDASTGEVTSYDGRETAPQAVTETLFLDDQGEVLPFLQAVVGGRSVGVPGAVKLLETLHQDHGQLPWPHLFQPAIELAEQGFAVSPQLAAWIAQDQDQLRRYPGTRAYFFDLQGDPLGAGTRLRNPGLADTLTTIAQGGASGFYQGEIAADVVATVREAADNPGYLSLEDLATYQVKSRPPVCIDYRTYQVCGMGPPSSGGLTVGQILGVLNHFDLSSLGPNHPQSWHLIGEASRLAFADRNHYIADADFVPVPTLNLIATDYLQQRATLIQPEGPILPEVNPGTPAPSPFQAGADVALPSTTHFSIVDAQGNAISMTSSIENVFGSRLMVRGFLLNNQLTDFSFYPQAPTGAPWPGGAPPQTQAVANRVQPGKRPRSSMAPTIVLDPQGKLYMVLGSPGGSRIIGYVAKTLIAHLDWGLDIQAAINLPHLINRGGAYELELDTEAAKLQAPLNDLGYETKVQPLNSGLHGIIVTPQGLEGGADPRREGIVLGD